MLLNQLWDSDNQTVSQLGQWSVKEPSTLTRQIDALVKKGYVERLNGTEDRRKVYVKLSRKGKALKKEFAAAGVRELDTDLVQIPDAQMQQFLKVLLQIKAQTLDEIRKLK